MISEKSLTKEIVSRYTSTIIPACRLLKPHATNIMFLTNNLVLMQPVIKGIRNYMILDKENNVGPFINTYVSLLDITKVNSKFRKTKSTIEWQVIDGTSHLVVSNDSDEPFKTPVLNNSDTITDLLNATYGEVPEWNTHGGQLLCDEPNSWYTQLPDKFIEDMVGKKLCDLTINDHTILISRPLLGDMKKTTYVGYRVICENDDKIVIKFKQTEALGNIYTYAAFLVI